MKKLTKKAIALTLCAGMVLGSTCTSLNADAAKKKKVKISKSSISLKVGASKKLVLKKGKKKVSAKWKSSDTDVAEVSKAGKVTGVSEGKAVISAKFKGKSYKCKVTVKEATSASPSPSATPSTKPAVSATPVNTFKPAGTVTPKPGTTTKPTSDPTPSSIPITTPDVGEIEDNNFDYETDVAYVDTSKNIRVEFEINKDVISEAELEELGYEVNGGVAAKDTICEVRTYTFQKLPNTLRGLQTIPLTGEYELDDPIEGYEYEENGIGFNTMMATACVAATFKGYSNPSDPFGDYDATILEMRKMFEYLNGPRSADDIANAKWQSTVDVMKNATATNQGGNPNVYLSYFGAMADNFYQDPGTGNYKLTVYRGPYMIPAKETINGKRPETYMIFIGEGKESNDWGTDRYIDVWKSSDGNWYSWQNSFANVIANNFKKAEEGF